MTGMRDMSFDGMNSLAHYVIGVTTVVALLLHPVMPVVMFATFIIYEVGQYYYEEDQPCKEIREYAVGLHIALIVLLLIG